MSGSGSGGYAEQVRHRAFQFVAGLVLIFATLTPLVNCFDSWDKGQPPANDTELQVTALFLGAGFVLVLPQLVPWLFDRTVRREQAPTMASDRAAPLAAHASRPVPSVSPPPIPLRI